MRGGAPAAVRPVTGENRSSGDGSGCEESESWWRDRVESRVVVARVLLSLLLYPAVSRIREEVGGESSFSSSYSSEESEGESVVEELGDGWCWREEDFLDLSSAWSLSWKLSIVVGRSTEPVTRKIFEMLFFFNVTV